jgi:hypothetical protein
LWLAGGRDIAQRQHAHHALVLVDHGQPAHLLGFHVADSVVQILVAAAEQSIGPLITSRAVSVCGIVPVRKGLDGNIAVRDHADEPVVFADGNRADVLVTHHAWPVR